MMRLFTGVLLCLSLAVIAFGQDSAAIVSKPLSVSSGIEAGQVTSGRDEQYQTYLLSGGHWLARLGVWLTQEVVIKKRLTFKMGVGGLFWYPMPETPGTADDYVTKFGPGISQATGIYSFGGEDLAFPWFQLQFGYFPFKYNNEATNLGEYRRRSGCYPGGLLGGNWNVVGDALYRVMGLRFSNYLLKNNIQHHFLISMERDAAPMYDLSLTLMGDYLLLNKIFDIGWGATYNHLLSANEKKTTPQFSNTHKSANRYYDGHAIGTGVATPDTNYYTFRGIKLMGKLTIDPKPLFPSSIFGKEDLKLFGEIAVLGVQDYPYYYDDITKRMPVMFGINLPFFKLLDVCAIQWEWYGSELENSLEGPLFYQMPIPPNPVADNPETYLDDTLVYQNSGNIQANYSDYNTFREFFSTDNWKWSIYMKRSFGKHLSLTLQMANDNFRSKWTSGRSQYIPICRGNDTPFGFFQKNWYYVFRFNYGI